MGCGKTTSGKYLAKRLNKKFYDLDSEIEKFMDISVADIILKFGEEYFRKMENQQLAMLCKESNAIIALGGGSLILEKNQIQIKKHGLLVYLMAEERTLMNRLEKSHKRPLLEKGFLELYEERKAGYLSANLCLRTDNFTPEQIAQRIISELELL
jgi:shikimate kinase